MQIYFQRTGGFAGMHLKTTVNTESLSPEEAAHLREMVDTAGFFNLPAAITTARGADRFQYKLTVEVEGRQHTVETGDETVPKTLRPLLEWLMARVRSTRQA